MSQKDVGLLLENVKVGSNGEVVDKICTSLSFYVAWRPTGEHVEAGFQSSSLSTASNCRLNRQPFFLTGWLLSLVMQFYDKFNIRHNISELLEYLWLVPSHHNAWKKVQFSFLISSWNLYYCWYLSMVWVPS
jgi:hypothetical protein